MSLNDSSSRRRLAWLLAALALVTTHLSPSGWNDWSRLATTQSLVESHSLVIDDTAFIATDDKVFIDGHFYSDKPPMAAVLAALVYLPLHAAGLTLETGRSVGHYVLTLVLMKGFWLFGTLAFFSALGFTPLDANQRLLASIVLGIGSTFFSWSGTVNNHALAAGCLAVGFYFVLKARFENTVARDLAIAGLFLSLAGAVDVPTGVFYALFFLSVIRDAHLRPAALFYLAPLMVTLAPTLAMNYAIHGHLTPVNVVREYFLYPGSPWTGSDGLSGMNRNSAGFAASYGVLTLVGPRGFLLYNPFLWIAIPGLVRAIRTRSEFFHEALLVGAGSVALVSYYALASTNYGGWSYSIRWFVPLLPLLLFFTYSYFEGLAGSRSFRWLLALSILIALVGAANPWSDPAFSPVPFVGNLIQLAERLGRLVGA